MAAKTLEEVLAALSGPEKALFETTLSKNPELKDGWLRQDDYSRKSQELQAKQAEYDEQKSYNERMKEWADRNVPRWEALEEKGYIDKETGEEVVTEKLSALEAQLAEARKQAVAGGEMTPEQLDAQVKQIIKDSGVALSKEEIANLYTSTAKAATEAAFDAKYAAAETNFNTKTIPIVTGIASAMAVAAMRYERETGKDFTDEDHRKIASMLNKDNDYDPRKAMAEYMKPLVDEKKNKAELERLANERAEQIIKDRGLMPGGGREDYIPQSSQKGSLQQMLERSAGDGDFESMIQSKAVEAAKALHAEGK